MAVRGMGDGVWVCCCAVKGHSRRGGKCRSCAPQHLQITEQPNLHAVEVFRA